MIYYGSCDSYAGRPDHAKFDGPVTFVCVGSPGGLHAASYWSDVSPIEKLIACDLVEPQIRYLEKCYRVMQEAQTRRDYYERLFDIRFAGEELTFRGADVSRMHTALGLPEPVIQEEQFVVLPRIKPPHDIGMKFRLEFAHQRDEGLGFGHGTGFLSQKCFPFTVPSAEFVVADVKDIIAQQMQLGEPTVVWMSNVCLTPVWGQSASFRRVVAAAMKSPHMSLWFATQDGYAKVLKSRRWLGLSIADKTPHAHSKIRIRPRLLDGSTVYVYPWHKRRPAGHISLEEYLDNPCAATNVVFHMCSFREQTSTSGPLPVSPFAYPLYSQALRIAGELSDRILVLEHNSETMDRRSLHNSGVLVRLVEDLAGRKADECCWCPGSQGLRRNFLLTFNR